MDRAHKWLPQKRQILYLVLLSAISSFSLLTGSFAQEKPAEAKKKAAAKTTKDLQIPTDELELMVKPLTLEELEIEVGAWMGELQKLAIEISNLEIAIKQQKTAIAKDENAASKLEKANQALKDAQAAHQKANESNDAQAIEAANKKLQEAKKAQIEAQKAVDEAKQATDNQSDEVKQAAQSALNEKAEEAQKKAEEAQQAGDSEEVKKAQEDAQKAQETAQGNTSSNTDDAETKKEEAKQKAAAKDTLTEVLTQKTLSRGRLIERIQVVLAAYALKGGDPASHQLYIDAVKGINIDVTDASATYTIIKTWITSDDGGIKWAINIGKFIAILFGFWLAAIILGRITQRAIKMSKKVSNLLGDFLNKFVRRIVLLIGFVIGLSALGVDIGPLLAAMGAAGFVIGFALQGSLSNFASGIMILMYRPFDVGDVVEAGGVAGKVESTSLFTTHIRTPDNKALIVPNNAIWGGVITNATSTSQRRVDLVFGIGYEDDIAQAQAIMEKLVQADERILKDPAPTIKVNELADSSVNFVCRPWVKTPDYWDVYWDLTRKVKEEFDANGISIPYPQQDIHVHHHAGEGGVPYEAPAGGK